MTTSPTRTYAWRPDVPDHRDYLAKQSVSAKLPDHVDRLGLKNPIEDQGSLGSCTGCSSTSALEIVTGITLLSKLMAYYNGRAYEGSEFYDSGAYIRDVVKGLANFGVCRETYWPYVESKVTTRPSPIAFKDGLSVKPLISSYQRVLDIGSMRIALAAGQPVIFGFSVPDYFESDTVAKTGWVPYPTNSAKIIGGHAVVAVGYDDRGSNPFVWVRNSWGQNWGIFGYFKMPYKWFTSSAGLVQDMWTFVPK